MDVTPIISAILGSGAISAGITFLTTRKKYNAEIESTKVTNFNDIINIYKNSIDDLEKRLNSVTDRYENLEKKYSELQLKLIDLIDENRRLKEKINTLKK